ncbi:hypothetical protein [Burkholderia perseverans]|uniref:hypothetical protein n=1 Tax=Burkholderia perseverans TaxID=2615214 RepID=UPI001FEE03C4|nr:hypothetical protein [Burkholderia perseverans]
MFSATGRSVMIGGFIGAGGQRSAQLQPFEPPCIVGAAAGAGPGCIGGAAVRPAPPDHPT